ncbi:MAG: hypothetical protein AB7F35_29230 [Acetobacteraceae bacterium]
MTVETVFDACRNMAAGSRHLADDFKAAAWTLAHRRYICGSVDCGQAYAARVEKLIRKTVPAPDAGPLPSPSPPPQDDDPSNPAPPSWDTFARIEWEMRMEERRSAPVINVRRIKE